MEGRKLPSLMLSEKQKITKPEPLSKKLIGPYRNYLQEIAMSGDKMPAQIACMNSGASPSPRRSGVGGEVILRIAVNFFYT